MSGSEYQHRIQDINVTDRPRERLAAVGANRLSNQELLAILLRVGVKGENAVQLGERLINDFGGLKGLQKATFDEISAEHGVGPAKAAQIIAAIELGNRISSVDAETRDSVHAPEDVVKLIKYELSALDHEELWVILLDTRNKFVAKERIYKGSVNASQVRVGEVFKTAVRKNIPHVIVAHNHPSGDPTPSPEDIALTRAMVQAGKLLDIEVLDHLIIGAKDWVSLKQRQAGFE
jgi:DNA repair protein RadC